MPRKFKKSKVSIFVFCSEQKENENYAISGVLAKDNSF